MTAGSDWQVLRLPTHNKTDVSVVVRRSDALHCTPSDSCIGSDLRLAAVRAVQTHRYRPPRPQSQRHHSPDMLQSSVAYVPRPDSTTGHCRESSASANANGNHSEPMPTDMMSCSAMASHASSERQVLVYRPPTRPQSDRRHRASASSSVRRVDRRTHRTVLSSSADRKSPPPVASVAVLADRPTVVPTDVPTDSEPKQDCRHPSPGGRHMTTIGDDPNRTVLSRPVRSDRPPQTQHHSSDTDCASYGSLADRCSEDRPLSRPRVVTAADDRRPPEPNPGPTDRPTLPTKAVPVAVPVLAVQLADPNRCFRNPNGILNHIKHIIIISH